MDKNRGWRAGTTVWLSLYIAVWKPAKTKCWLSETHFSGKSYTCCLINMSQHAINDRKGTGLKYHPQWNLLSAGKLSQVSVNVSCSSHYCSLPVITTSQLREQSATLEWQIWTNPRWLVHLTLPPAFVRRAVSFNVFLHFSLHQSDIQKSDVKNA